MSDDAGETDENARVLAALKAHARPMAEVRAAADRLERLGHQFDAFEFPGTGTGTIIMDCGCGDDPVAQYLQCPNPG